MGQCCSKCCSKASSKAPARGSDKGRDEGTGRYPGRHSDSGSDSGDRDTANQQLPSDKSSEHTPLLPHDSPAINYSQSTPRLPIVQQDQLHQEVPPVRDNSSFRRTPRRTPVQLEAYPPAHREADRPAQAEPHPFVLSDKIEPSVQETAPHYLKEHEELPFMFDEEAQLANPLHQSHKMVIFEQSISLTETHQDQVTPQSNVTPPQNNFQRSTGSNRQTGRRQMRPWLHELKVSPLSEGLEIRCPMLVSSIMQGSCDHNGGILITEDGIKLSIPKGAITDGDLVTFYFATDLYGPFKLPSHSQADLVNPYYWIGVSRSYRFQKYIQVEFEHYGGCDPSHYQLLCCEDDDESYTMQPVNYDLVFKTSSCIFQTYHFCSYCLFHNCKTKRHNTINRVATLYLKPKNFEYLNEFSVEIWFSFPIKYCLKRNKELFKLKHMTLDTQCNHVFDVSCDKNSESYFCLEYNQTDDYGWGIEHLKSTEIKTREVNFYNWYQNKEDLQASEENSLFPPRFVINVIKKAECTTDLNTNIKILLHKIEKKNSVQLITLKLFRSLSAISIKHSTSLSKDTSLPSVGLHTCGKDEPKLKDLIKYSTKISTRWKEIAIELKIPDDIVETIDLNNPLVERKCYNMFKIWLDRRTKPLCWCNFVQALYIVKLEGIAEDVNKKHLEKQSCENSYSKTPPGVMSPQSDMSEMNMKHDTYDQGGPLNMQELVRYLKKLEDVPESDFRYFIIALLPTESATQVMRDIRRCGGSIEDSVKKICKQFLKEEDPSWSKIYEALKKANCYELASLVEATFLPV